MPFVDDFLDMLVSEITYAPFVSRDAYGEPTFGSPVTYEARVIRKHKMVRNVEGQQVISTAHIWVGGIPFVSPQDKITLDDGTHPPIIAIERFEDEIGPSHTVVYFL